jgi:hypothetical protein
VSSRYAPGMLDIGGLEMLLFVGPMWALTAFAIYWIIRLGVRHGTLDAYRIDRTDQRFARLHAEQRAEAQGRSDQE